MRGPHNLTSTARPIAAALIFLVWLAIATAAQATPLLNSNYDSQDGDQLNNTPGAILDWEDVAGAARLTSNTDNQALDNCFIGGVKEDTPDAWDFNTTAGGCTPGKSDLLGMWSHTEITDPNTFLHAAFVRSAASGNTFITFELNRLGTSWINGVGATIPCRSTGDLLLSYEVGGSTVSVTIFRWTGDGSGPASCPDGANGTFTSSSALNNGLLSTASITNFLSTGIIGNTIGTALFGEAQIDVSAVLGSMGVTGCYSYVAAQAHTRSSSSISSALIDYVPPTVTQVANCVAAGTVYDDADNNGTRDIGEGGLVGRTVFIDYDGDDALDPGEPTKDTDSQGYYAIPNVNAGSFDVEVVVPATKTCTDPVPCSHSRTFTASTNSSGNDFGLYTPPAADLSVSDVAPATVNQGEGFDYTLTVDNAGPSTADSVTVVETLPAGVTFVSASAGCTRLAGVVTCTAASLASGSQLIFTITVTATGTGVVTDSAVASSSTIDPDSADLTDSVDVTINPTADLSLVKTGSATVDPGQDATYTLTVDNAGPSSASNATAIDVLPTGLTYVSATPSQGTCNQSAGTVTCNLGTIASGSQATVTVVATAAFSAANSTLTNNASVSGDQYDPDGTDDSDSFDTDVGPAADLSLDVTAPASVNQGADFDYTLTIDNAGPSAADSVTVIETLPAGVTFVSASAGCTQLAGIVTCTAASLVSGGQLIFTITVTATGTGVVTDSAVASSSTIDPDSADLTDSVDVTIATGADLQVTKTGSATVDPGQNASYTVTVENSGPLNATNVSATDTLPTGLTYVSATPSQGTCSESAGAITCDLGTIASGSQATIAVVATAEFSAAGQTLTNTAQASTDQTDPDSSNDSSSTDTDVGPAADLSLAVSAPASVTAGDLLTYSLQVQNGGPSDATGVTVTDPLPAGLSVATVTPSQGSCTVVGQLVTCTLGNVPNGGSAQITLTVSVASSLAGQNIQNDAAVSANEPDPTPANNPDSIQTQVNAATTPPPAGIPNLSITKVADQGSMTFGGTMSYTITVSNTGAADATGVTMNDLPGGAYSFVSSMASQGSCNGLACDLGTIVAGSFATVRVAVKPLDPGSFTNSASAAAANGDRDVAADTAGATISVVTRRTVLRLRERISRSRVSAGDSVVIRLSVKNTGKYAAADVLVCLSPSNLISYTKKNGGRLVRGRLCWTIPMLEVGKTRNFSVRARVASSARSVRIRNPSTATSINADGRKANRSVKVDRADVRGGGVTG